MIQRDVQSVATHLNVVLNFSEELKRRAPAEGSRDARRRSRLGPYEILSPLGAGGMGEVYKARDTRLERTVAVKVLPSHLSASPEVRQRFEREAKTISQLSHPHICALYDVGREGETEYLVMELLEGETLSERLAKGALPLEQTLRYGMEIADALDKAHRQGIVHRDLKPGNVMLTKSGVKLLDFGLAKAMAPASAAVEPDVAADAAGPDAGRHDPRDVPVHGAGAARRQGRRRADGHLRVRARALRDGDGKEGVLGVEPGVLDHGDHVERAGADLVRPADVAAGARPGREDLPRQGSRGPLADRPATWPRSSSGSPRAPRPVSRRRWRSPPAAGIASESPGAPSASPHWRRPPSGSASSAGRRLRRASSGSRSSPPTSRPTAMCRAGSRHGARRVSRWPTPRVQGGGQGPKDCPCGLALSTVFGLGPCREPRTVIYPFWSPDSRLHRLLRRRKAEAHGRFGRSRPGALRRGGGARRDMES